MYQRNNVRAEMWLLVGPLESQKQNKKTIAKLHGVNCGLRCDINLYGLKNHLGHKRTVYMDKLPVYCWSNSYGPFEMVYYDYKLSNNVQQKSDY